MATDLDPELEVEKVEITTEEQIEKQLEYYVNFYCKYYALNKKIITKKEEIK